MIVAKINHKKEVLEKLYVNDKEKYYKRGRIKNSKIDKIMYPVTYNVYIDSLHYRHYEDRSGEKINEI